MMGGFHVEILMVAGYALFLVAAALLLELVARHSHRLSERFEVAGLKDHRPLDHWECPTGQRLERSAVDYGRRIVLYRAPAHLCNACGIKQSCTDSESGRQIEQRLDSWLPSELRRFHRGLSLLLFLLAGLLLVFEMDARDSARDLAVLWGLLLSIGVACTRLVSEFFARSVGP